MNSRPFLFILLITGMIFGSCSPGPKQSDHITRSSESVSWFLIEKYNVDTSEFEITSVEIAVLDFIYTKEAQDLRDTIEEIESRLADPYHRPRINEHTAVEVQDSTEYQYLADTKKLYLTRKQEFEAPSFYAVSVKMEPDGNWKFLIDTSSFEIWYFQTCRDCAFITAE